MIALASCSRETIEVITPEMSTSYAKISISMASAPGTRADWGYEGEFDNGTQAESNMALEDIHLVFYDDNGFVVGSGKHITTALDEGFSIATDPRTGTESVSDENAVVFQLDLNEGAPLPTKVAAFINVDPMTFNLDKISDIMTNVSKVYKTDKGYIMTSAGYYNEEGEYVIAAELNSDAIFTTISQAADAGATKAADIYVERLAAKVSIDASKEKEVDQKNQKFIVKNPDGEVLTVKFSANDFNWGITGTAKAMYMLKQPFDNTDTWMNGKFRSYWAKGANWGTEYNDYLPEDGDPVLNYLSYNAIVEEGNKNGEVDYALEHTYDYSKLKVAPLFNVNVPTTSAIVIGTYEISNGNTTINFDEKGFYLLYAGTEDGKSLFTLYNREELIIYLVNGKTIYDENGEEVEDFSLTKVGTQFKLVASDWSAKIDSGECTSTTLYTDPEQKNEVAKTNARHYVMSMGYFFVPIEHHATSTETKEGVIEPITGYYGVVRNHSYVLTISAIQGLAAPLDDKYTDKGDEFDPEDPDEGDPDEPIIPDPDDLKEAYIQASIKVLSWHVVNQDVKL